jgi:hypothetical protein
MEPKPVQYHKPPAYPTRRDVLAGAASFALAGLAGRSFVFAATEEGKAVVAPIFEHGEGRGAEGCIVVTPPVFLSEEEGMQIIREELAKHGVELKAGGTIEGVRIPRRVLKGRRLVEKDNGRKEYEDKTVEVPNSAKPLRLGGIDSKKRIVVEFVSQSRYSDLGGPLIGGSVMEYDLKGVAEYVAQQVKKQGKERLFIGVLYDPLNKLSLKGDWKKETEQRKEESEKQVRHQAQDFIAWLKKQKAID